MRRGVSPIVATLILTLVGVASVVIMYAWLSSAGGETTPGNPILKSAIRISSVSVVSDERVKGYGFALDVYVSNIGKITTFLSNSSLYVMKGGSLVAKGICPIFGSSRIEIDPGDTVKIRCYLDNMLDSGSYEVKVATLDGVEATYTLQVPHLIGKSTVQILGRESTEQNPLISEDAYAIYRSWIQGNKAYFRVYAKVGVTIEALRAEVFNRSGQHPLWVGVWSVFDWTTPYTSPDYAGAEWYPIEPSELPLTIVYTVYVSKS